MDYLENSACMLGIDIGGTGIKGALIDTITGQLLTPRIRYATPKPATPTAIAHLISQIADDMGWNGPIGCTFPALMQKGIVLAAANLDASWLGLDAAEIIHQLTGYPVSLLNDADAAALAEVNFGAGQAERGKVLLLTFGTGIGSALIVNREVIGSTELGHLLFPSDSTAEKYCSGKLVKGASALSWVEYAERLNGYLQHLELLVSPDLFILGGGICKNHEHLQHLLKTQRTAFKFAALGNNAGIVGAALVAHQEFYLPAARQL